MQAGRSSLHQSDGVVNRYDLKSDAGCITKFYLLVFVSAEKVLSDHNGVFRRLKMRDVLAYKDKLLYAADTFLVVFPFFESYALTAL